MLNSIAPFGLRHEIAKRYTPLDWYKSLEVKRQIDDCGADRIITELIVKGSPALIGRLGGTEARFLSEYLKLERLERFGLRPEKLAQLAPRWAKRNNEVFTNAGFYHDSYKDVAEFWNLYKSALLDTDILGAWGVAFTWVEGLALNSTSKKVIPVGFTAPWVEPYKPGQDPWSRSLEGKKVLVISGFANSIQKQHERIDKVFNLAEYPKFELQTIKAPLVAGNRPQSDNTWFELLYDMKSKMESADFDIALVSAGAFSYPLAQFAKTLGGIGIHCGGGLQLFFGVMGNRWNNSPEVLKFHNEYWVRPSSEETPPSAQSIENGCYW